MTTKPYKNLTIFQWLRLTWDSLNAIVKVNGCWNGENQICGWKVKYFFLGWIRIVYGLWTLNAPTLNNAQVSTISNNHLSDKLFTFPEPINVSSECSVKMPCPEKCTCQVTFIRNLFFSFQTKSVGRHCEVQQQGFGWNTSRYSTLDKRTLCWQQQN